MLKSSDGSELAYAELSREELVMIEDLERTMKQGRDGLILLAFEPKN